MKGMNKQSSLCILKNSNPAITVISRIKGQSDLCDNENKKPPQAEALLGCVSANYCVIRKAMMSASSWSVIRVPKLTGIAPEL